MHHLSPVLWGQEAELEFLKVRPWYPWKKSWCSRAHSQQPTLRPFLSAKCAQTQEELQTRVLRLGEEGSSIAHLAKRGFWKQMTLEMIPKDGYELVGWGGYVTQQLLEYGVLVHQVLPEKTRLEGEVALGICAKGLIIYEVKNNSRIATLQFQWREVGKISIYLLK
ncbi:FERM and PDZ domain containing 2 [Phyllostomus discolor]|uniref:FERM and PDZ domain containing 2 n=1 Tax=Phyllostomus discolor TaxID=89673 RepID=A0A834ACX9_9CHIR|nr:FERM and PDZ domain containing 2 [Phyllostomus discolor]